MKAGLARQIFREYDIRGRFLEEFTEDTSRRIGQAFGTILARGKRKREEAILPAAEETGGRREAVSGEEKERKGKLKKEKGGPTAPLRQKEQVKAEPEALAVRETGREGIAGKGKGKTRPGETRAGPGVRLRGVEGEEGAEPEVAKAVEDAPRIRIAVGGDLRASSPAIKKALIDGLTSTGADVLDLGLIPTPVLYFGIVHFDQDAGIAVTASHNPPEYNGFKFQLRTGPFYGEEIQTLAREIEKKDFARGQGSVRKADALTPYRRALQTQFHYSRRLKVAIDSGHGMAGLVAPSLFRDLGHDVTELYTNLDPTFPDHQPDPSHLENLEDLLRAVREKGADIGIAFDGDADRIGVVDEKGDPILGDRLMLLFAQQVLQEKPGAKIIGDVKCSPLVYREIERRGGRPILWKTGHSLLKAKLKEEKAAFAGEMSGHMFFADRWYGFDDAIYAAARLLEILDQVKRPLSNLLADFPQVFSTPEIRVKCASDQKKFEIVRAVTQDLKKDYRVMDLDGARIEFDDGWGLVRASNTEPALVMRFEAKTEKRLAEIRTLIEGKIRKYA